MKYLVTEIQTMGNGEVSNLTYAYDTENEALAKFHTILAAAAISNLPVHAALMFSNEGTPLRYECFKH